MNRATLACIALIGFTTAAAAQPVGPPPVFADTPVAEAIKQSVGSDKLLVIKATILGHPGLRRWDATTWRDPVLVDWLSTNAVAVEFDIRASRRASRPLKIDEVGVVAVVGGVERGRITGSSDAEEIVALLESVRKGSPLSESSLEFLRRERLGALESQARERYSAAVDLRRAQRYDDAVLEYVWLWENTAKLSFTAAPVSREGLALEMRRLAVMYPPAAAGFARLRDEAEAVADLTKDGGDTQDFLSLNAVLGDDARTLAWYDKAREDREWRAALSRSPIELREALVAADRWSDLAALIGDPLATVDQAYRIGWLGRGDAVGRNSYRRGAAAIYASLLAGGRSDDAEVVLGAALTLDDSAEMRVGLVECAFRANKPRAEHLLMLDHAADLGADVRELRQRVEQALAAK